MNVLPNEIWIKIFSFLHQQDKVECMVTCHQWKQLISSTCLFQTVCIYSTEGLQKTIKRMQKDPEQAKRVERLAIDFLTEDDIDLNPLLPLLPNLKDFLLIAPEAYQAIEDGLVYPWHKHITHITECAVKTVAHQLLSTSLCPNLKTLSITDNFYDIAPVLGNAPALENLDICLGHLRFADLHSIHKNSPRLKSLTLSIVTLDGYDFTHDIVPAVSMRECSFTNVHMHTDIDQTEIKFLKFISMKYPNLTKLEYHYNAREANRTKSELEYVNKFGWFPLFQRLSPNLKNFRTGGGSEPMDLYKMLDESRCQLFKLTLDAMTSKSKILELAKSNQAQYIQSLKLDHMKTFDFKWLKKFPVLKKLRLAWTHNYRHKGVNLSRVLGYCPKLKSISIQFVNVYFDNNDTLTYPVETISFRAVHLPPYIDQFISSHFPKLNRLKLKRIDLQSETFDISSVDLFSFQINAFLRKKDHLGMIVRTNLGETWYPLDEERSYLTFSRHGKGHDPTINPDVKALPVDKNRGQPYFTLLCNSLQHFSFKDD